MGIPEALEELEDADPQEFADALKDQRNDHYNAVFRVGFGAGKGEVQSKLEKRESEIESLQSDKESLQQQIEEMQGDSPELEEALQKKEQALQEKQNQVDQLQDEVSQARQEGRQALKSERMSNLQEGVANRLMEMGVLDRDIANTKAQSQQVQKRVDFDDELNLKVYQEDGETPYQLKQDQDPADALAEEVAGTMPGAYFKDTRPGSSGIGSTRSNGHNVVDGSDLEGGKVDPQEVLDGNVDVRN